MNAVLETNLAGQQVSHYIIGDLIGTGAMGRVYLARDETLRRHVAIKILLDTPPADASQRLLEEARLLSRVAHPNLAAIYDFVELPERGYIVMEFVPGATLKEVLTAGPLPVEDVLRLGVQLARAVDAAHTARILHRDLNPQNIKLTPAGRLKVLDFGVAALIPPHSLQECFANPTASVRVVGTFPYMSPEQLRGEQLDERSDIFSVGALLYEMAAGRPAFPRQSLARLVDAIQHEDPPPITDLNPFLPTELDTIIRKALEKDRKRRFTRAAALAAELRALRMPAAWHARRFRLLPGFRCQVSGIR
jgi:serine/threonine protein kinase